MAEHVCDSAESAPSDLCDAVDSSSMPMSQDSASQSGAIETATKDASNNNIDPGKIADGDWSNQDFTNVKLISGPDFAGANLNKAILPNEITDFFEERLKQIEELSKNAGKLFVTLLVMCVFSFLTVAQTKHIDLFTDHGVAKMPVIDAQVPITMFFILMPITLFGVYCYFHVYLQRLWEAIAQLPAIFPDGQTIVRKTYPWLLNEIVRDHFNQLKTDCPPLSGVEKRLSVFIAWYLVPLSILPFWAHYLVCRDIGMTVLHVAVFGVMVWSAWLLYNMAKITLRSHGDTAQSRERIKRSDGLLGGVASFVVTLGLAVVSILAFHGLPNKDVPLPRQYSSNRNSLYIAVPSILKFLGCSPFAALSQEDISTRPGGWKATTESDFASVRGAQLRGVDLRYASLDGAFLANAGIDKANLMGVNLVGADLRKGWLLNSDFFGADLEGAHFCGANLTFSHLCFANMSKADFSKLDKEDDLGADLSRAKMVLVDLTSANLSNASMRGADLRGADLRHAKLIDTNLFDADLRGADLRDVNMTGAKGIDLRWAQIDRPQLFEQNHPKPANLYGAIYDKNTKWPVGTGSPSVKSNIKYMDLGQKYNKPHFAVCCDWYENDAKIERASSDP